MFSHRQARRIVHSAILPFVFALMLAACGPGAASQPMQEPGPPGDTAALNPTAPAVAEAPPEERVETNAPEPTVAPAQDPVVLLPTPTPTPGPPAPTPHNWLTTATVEGDYYILGNPAAPVRLVDYSDFL